MVNKYQSIFKRETVSAVCIRMRLICQVFYFKNDGMTYLDETERYILSNDTYAGFDISGVVWLIDATRAINGGLPYLKDLVP